MRSDRVYPRVFELESRLVPSTTYYHSTLPSTQNSIMAFNDQITTGLSDAVVKFIATHSAGTQKELAADNARFVANNPNWVLLDYRLATASGPAQYIHNGTWTSDWASVTANESWFMHNAQNQRLHNSTWDWDLHDINNADFRNYFFNNVIGDLQTNHAQGLFGDSFEAGIGGWWFDQSDARFAGTNAGNPAAWPNGYTWIQQLHDWAGAVINALHAQPQHYMFIPNVNGLTTSWANQDFSNVDGVFMENFGNVGGGSYHQDTDPGDWVLSMNRALALSSLNRVLIMQAPLNGTPDSAAGQVNREYLLATYLLLKGKYTYINMLPNGGSLGAYYYPEYGLNLGAPLTALPSNVSQLLWNGVYRRDFRNGFVLVNPGTSSITIDFGQQYTQVTGTGGGTLSDSSLDANGNFIGGSLVKTNVQSITLAPGTAGIYLTSKARSKSTFVDNGGGAYQETGGGWASATMGYGGTSRTHGAGAGDASASWTVKQAAVGTFDVQVTWVANAAASRQATYQIYDGQNLLVSVSVDQTVAPSETAYNGSTFQSLGHYHFASGSIRVVLVDSTDGSVNADALHLQMLGL